VVRGRARGSDRLQKSTGGARPFTPEDEESSDHDDGSSPSARERRGGERASEAGSSVAKPRDRWRVPSKPVEIARAVRLGNTCRWKALRIGKVVPLTRGRRKRSWLLESVRVSGLLRGATGSVRGRTSASRMAENARPRWHRQKAAPGIHRAERRGEAVHGSAEAGGAPSSARPAGAGSPQGGSGVARENPTLGSGKHPAVSAARAARPEVERSTGARVVSRLQRSERSIFSATSRGAARQTEVVRGSTERRRASTGRVRTLRAKGCEDFRANLTGNAGGFARSQDRDRTGGRHSGLMDGVVLNRKASCGVLATWGATTPDERREPKRRTRERRSRGSTHGATESVRGRDVRWGSPSRRAQGVSSQRERSSGFTPHAWVPWAGRLPRCARRQIVAEAATAKNRGIRRRERQRELFDPPHGNRRRTKMPRCAASSA
jgi:hypothetical protein